MAIAGIPLDKRGPYTYLIGWRALDLWYYGVRYAQGCDPSELWTSYFTSSKRIPILRSLHGEPDVVEVRQIFANPLKATAWESRVLKRMGAVQSKRWINLARGSVEFNTSSSEVRLAISRAKKGHVQSKETRDKISKSRSGKPMPTSAKISISKANKGKVLSSATRTKISDSRLGIVFSEETKEKMRAARTGKKDSAATIEKRKATLAARRASCQFQA